MSIKATLVIGLSVTETLAANMPFVNAQKNSILHDGLNLSMALPGAGVGSVGNLTATDVIPAQVALVSGAATIDLTSLTGSDGRAISASGLKVQAVIFRNNPTNANPMLIGKGASNGYSPITGDAFSIPLPPGASALLMLNGGAASVDGTHKTLDIAGTGTQILDMLIVLS